MNEGYPEWYTRRSQRQTSSGRRPAAKGNVSNLCTIRERPESSIGNSLTPRGPHGGEKVHLPMPPKKNKRVCEPSGDNVRWVDGWPYRVYADGVVKIGTGAEGSVFPRFMVRLTSYADADYNNLAWRDSVVQEVIIRGNKGRGPGAHWRFDFALHLPYSLHL